ncbi:glycosyltransferase family 2 protein [Acidiferrimicrobium sp. IK]|uniref:glycosyltransferase family 2 protein n=1 Tax=Acidiferrimicrobium sp. IK TaxID=2871700 RepID=UPI0021CB664D|nr:glycosyltransferase family 2 protein [Acidiferrimicrobium sp. IK]MCU4185567.1 glycosyltransferase family 2 protein [Acidiferrimicrobium sp. IK]
MAAAPRVLLAITLYNGKDVVFQCLDSAARLSEQPGVDALVLDDASPAPGWSERVEAACAERRIGYYRSPRNLGIPRNVNMGMLAAQRGGYDYVVICNSDIIMPANLIEQLVEVARTDPSIGSVTAFSNNVSVYSLPNTMPDRYLAEPGVADWVSASLAGEFGHAAIDIPAGISFCMLVPTKVMATVGLMDPVFGRGYCEETDWTQRSRAAGYRITLAPGVFAYHSGQGSTTDAGLLSHGHTTVPANERIIDLRYPMFRQQVEAFVYSGILQTLHRNAALRIIRDGARAYGYSLHLSWLHDLPGDSLVPRCILRPEAHGSDLLLEFRGFSAVVPLAGRSAPEAIVEEMGGPPANIDVFDRGSALGPLQAAFGAAAVRDHYSYPERV